MTTRTPVPGFNTEAITLDPHGRVVILDPTLLDAVTGGIARENVGPEDPEFAGTIALDSARLTPWLRGFRSLDAEELACPAVGLPKQSAELLQIGSREF
jgi:hypothetical protein